LHFHKMAIAYFVSITIIVFLMKTPYLKNSMQCLNIFKNSLTGNKSVVNWILNDTLVCW
jgi:hypothetical protein